MPLPHIDPPLLNSANPWCTTLEDLQALYDDEFTGAVTTRTSLLKAFEHDATIHQHTFFDPRNHGLKPTEVKDGEVSDEKCGSLNTLGYSPFPLNTYLDFTSKIANPQSGPSKTKPFIISVTGSPEDILECYAVISHHQSKVAQPLCMEINLSCPNIPNKPPPAYSGTALLEYLHILQRASAQSDPRTKVPVGIKTPPYTHAGQFQTLIDALRESCSNGTPCPIDFITATNTLGSCLLLTPLGDPALASASGAGVGGMAGAPLHPLALGNVKTLRTMLDEHKELQDIDIVGVGGVDDRAGFDRMMSVGAKVVGIGTALGREGVAIFSKIAGEDL